MRRLVIVPLILAMLIPVIIRAQDDTQDSSGWRVWLYDGGTDMVMVDDTGAVVRETTLPEASDLE